MSCGFARTDLKNSAPGGHLDLNTVSADLRQIAAQRGHRRAEQWMERPGWRSVMWFTFCRRDTVHPATHQSPLLTHITLFNYTLNLGGCLPTGSLPSLLPLAFPCPLLTGTRPIVAPSAETPPNTHANARTPTPAPTHVMLNVIVNL